MILKKTGAFLSRGTIHTLGAILLAISANTMADTWNTGTANQITPTLTTTNVGIGTSTITSGAKLDVNGHVNVRNRMNVIGNTVGQEALVVTQSAASGAIFDLRNGTGSRFTVTNAGRVGVGTTNPGANLDVMGTLRASSIEGNSIYPVTAFGAANFGTLTGDVTNDQTGFFQQAIDYAYAHGGGIVSIPGGEFRIDGNLIIHTGVTLEGICKGLHGAHRTTGTILWATAGQGDSCGTPFITLKEDAKIKGVTIYYPAQTNLASILPFPWTISGQIDGRVEDVTLANSYQGIRFANPGGSNGHTIQNVNMTAFKMGVLIDNSFDVGRIENVHINPRFWFYATNTSWSDTAAQRQINEYTLANLVGFSFREAQWEMVNGCFVIFALTGMEFFRDLNKTGANTMIVNSGTDLCKNPVIIDQANAQHGMTFTNCQFALGAAGNPFTIGPNNIGNIKISNSSFIFGTTSLIRKSGTGHLQMNDCVFWGFGGSAVEVAQGTASISNSEFNKNSSAYYNAVLPGSGTRTLLTSNLLRGFEAGLYTSNVFRSNNMAP